MSRIALADESGISDNTVCYAIGVISMDSDHLPTFNDEFRRLSSQHGVQGEPKWEHIRKSHGLINFLLHWTHTILQGDTLRFSAIVVNTNRYNKWSKRGADREAAFYTTYNLLLKYVADNAGEPTEVLIDDRSDSYEKRTETTKLILDRMLLKRASPGNVHNLRKVSSRETPGVQLADLLTGALREGYRLRLDPRPERRPNEGKMEALRRLTRMLGWKVPWHDTMPNPNFNIWHFPTERGLTREIVLAEQPPYIDGPTLAKAWQCRQEQAASGAA